MEKPAVASMPVKRELPLTTAQAGARIIGSG
jgi:hypothetical protein